MDNFSSVIQNSKTTYYVYDNLGQLIRVNDQNDPTSGTTDTTWISDWVFKPQQNVATDDAYDMEKMAKANDPKDHSTDSNMKIVEGKIWIKGTALTATAGKDFYLQSGNSVRINGLPASATYTVTEVPEDYQATPAVDADPAGAGVVTNYKNVTSGVLGEVDRFDQKTGVELAATAIGDDLVATSFRNTREGVIPTGIISVIAPAVAVIVLGGAGLGFVVASKRREEEEEA